MKKLIVFTLGIFLLTLTACEEEIDYFNPNFTNETTNTKAEVLDLLHHFAERTTDKMPWIDLDENYYPIQNEDYQNQPIDHGERFNKDDFNDNIINQNVNKLDINALNLYVWDIEEILKFVEKCDFQERQPCVDELVERRELTITMEENQLLIEYNKYNSLKEPQTIEVLRIYLADINEKLYMDVEKYIYETDGYKRKTEYIYYQDHYSKEYFNQNLNDLIETTLTVKDINEKEHYFIRLWDDQETPRAFGFYNYENDTYYMKNYPDEFISLHMYNNEDHTFSFNKNETYQLSYDLLDVKNWDYIERMNNGLYLYQNNQIVDENISVHIDIYGPSLYRELSGTPSDGQVSLNDIGLNYNITMDEINQLILDNEAFTEELLETLNYIADYQNNLNQINQKVSLTYSDEDIITLLNEKTNEGR